MSRTSNTRFVIRCNVIRVPLHRPREGAKFRSRIKGQPTLSFSSLSGNPDALSERRNSTGYGCSSIGPSAPASCSTIRRYPETNQSVFPVNSNYHQHGADLFGLRWVVAYIFSRRLASTDRIQFSGKYLFSHGQSNCRTSSACTDR